MSSTASAQSARGRQTRRSRSAIQRIKRAGSGVLALLCAAVCLTLGLHHPLAPAVILLATLGVALAVYRWPVVWPVLLPSLIPVIGLAPWSGWITFEETDLLVLAIAAGGYAHIAVHLRNMSLTERTPRGTLLYAMALAGFGVLTVVAMLRGFENAGGFVFGWYQGYHEPMNALRIAKAFMEALLLLPLWLYVSRTRQGAALALQMGMGIGLALAALATVWERVAFTGLLNFSSDYRTTALFWEMHVGGAALDGFLALTVPFAAAFWLRARTPGQWAGATAVLLLAAYSCLTTFSRGVYLAIPVGLALMAVLERLRQRNARMPFATAQVADGAAASAPTVPRIDAVPAVGLVLAYLGGASWMFSGSGYRGLLALLGSIVLALPVVHLSRTLTSAQRVAGLVAGLLLGMAALPAALWLPKGAYIAWTGLAALCVLCLWSWLRARQPSPSMAVLALGAQLGTLMATAWVALVWGGPQALGQAAPVAIFFGACVVALGFAHQPPWPSSLRWQGSIALAMAVTSASVGVFAGGAYMDERFSTGGRDLEGRLSHWRVSRDMLVTPADFWLGKGLGRYPSSYFLTGDPEQHPGDYRLKVEGDNPYLTLSGGLHVNGWGEIFRVSQRISEPGTGLVFTARVRAQSDADLHVEVCAKHLLYDDGSCSLGELTIKAGSGDWQTVRLPMSANTPTRGSWYAPRMIVFSMASSSRGSSLDLDDVVLANSQGDALLANGDFSHEMARWFFSSDRNHLPWHAKNLWLHLAVEQGVLSAAAFTLLVALGLWRTCLGTARRHPLAPAVAAGLVGFLVVGLFDSLLDVPRVAMLFYTTLGIALLLPTPARLTTADPASPVRN